MYPPKPTPSGTPKPQGLFERFGAEYQAFQLFRRAGEISRNHHLASKAAALSPGQAAKPAVGAVSPCPYIGVHQRPCVVVARHSLAGRLELGLLETMARGRLPNVSFYHIRSHKDSAVLLAAGCAWHLELATGD